MPSSPVSSSSAPKSDKRSAAAGQKATHATTVQGVTPSSSEIPKNQAASGDDVQQRGIEPVEKRRSRSAGKLPDNGREVDVDTEKDNSLEVGDAVDDEEADNMGRVVVGLDGITRVNGTTVFLPLECSSCVQAEERCTGVTGKACDRCRSLRRKCSFSRGGRGPKKTESDGPKKNSAEARKAGTSSGGVKRKAEGGSQARPKRSRRSTTTLNPETIEGMLEAEGSGNDAIFQVVGNYIESYSALVDWFEKERARRAKRA